MDAALPLDGAGLVDPAPLLDNAASPLATSPLLLELRAQAAIALPLALTLVCRFAQGFIDLAVCGRFLGTDALAGASLALTFLFAGVNVITMGFGDAVAALCAQALGAGEPRLCGVWLQLGMAASSLAVLAVLAPAWAFIGAPLRALSAGDHVADLAQLFARASLPRMLLHANYYCLKMWLASQRRLAPDVAGNVAGLGVGLLVNILLVGGTCALAPPPPERVAGPCWQGLGFAGAPVAGTLARALVVALVVGLALGPWRPAAGAPATFAGWALHAGPDGSLRGDRVRRFLALALPAGGRAALDQGAVLGLALLAGSLGATAAGAHNALVELYAVACALSWALGDAVMVRVGLALGAGDAEGARRAAAVGVALGAGYAVVAPAVLLPLAPWLGQLFSGEGDVVALAAATVPAMSALVAVSSVLFASLGAATARGRSGARAGARAWLAGSAVVLPAAWTLSSRAGLGVPGLWWAWAAGYALCACLLGVEVALSDWPALAADASAAQAAAAAGARAVGDKSLAVT